MSRFPGRRTLIRRILLLYTPSRPTGWLYHLLFYCLVFILLPFMVMVGFGAYIGPDRSLQGIPVVFFVVMLCFIVHRRAVSTNATPKPVLSPTGEQLPPPPPPFVTRHPPLRRPILGYGLSLGGTVWEVTGFICLGLFANGIIWLIVSVVGFDELLQWAAARGIETTVDVPAELLAFLSSGPWLAVVALLAIVVGLSGSIYGLSQGMRMRERGRRLRARDARTILKRCKKQPVLLLRSFGDENMVDPRPMAFLGLRYEERLVHALEPIGPVIAIGRPGDTVGYGGAARLYVSDDHWQDAIRDLMKIAVAVVFIVAETQGLWWEIETALKTVRRQRLLFFFPYVYTPERRRTRFHDFIESLARWNLPRGRYRRMEQERVARYQIFCTRIANMLDCELPPKLDRTLFIDFSTEGTLRLIKSRSSVIATLQSLLLPLRRYRKLRVSIGRSLKPFVRKLLHHP